MKYSVWLTRILIIAMALIVQTGLLYAQEGAKAGFALSMDSRILTGRPGQTVESSITIVTYGVKTTSRFVINSVDLGQTVSGSPIPVERGKGANSCADWIRVQERIEIPPDGSLTVPFSIAIPPNVTGAHYAYVQVRNLTERPDDPLVILIEPVLSVKVELEVPGRNRIELTTKGLSFDRQLINGRPGMLLEVKNEGNLKASLEGDILLYRDKRTFPVRAQIPMDGGGSPPTIYPGITLSLTCPFDKEPSPGNYDARVRLRLDQRWRTKSNFEILIPESGSATLAAAKAVGMSEFDIDVRVEPDFVEVMVPPGATRTVAIRIFNRDTVAVQTRASVVDVVQEPNGFMTYADISDPDQQWVSISPEEWTLKPKSAKSLLLKITAPEYEPGKGEKCAVRIIGTAGKDETGWLSEADLGIPIIAVAPGSSPPDFEISMLEIVRPAPSKNPTAAILGVANQGGRTAKLTGEFVLERADTGERIQTFDMSKAGDIILPPGAVREFRMPLSLLDKDEFRLYASVAIAGQPRSEKIKDLTFTCYQGPE